MGIENCKRARAGVSVLIRNKSINIIQNCQMTNKRTLEITVKINGKMMSIRNYRPQVDKSTTSLR